MEKNKINEANESLERIKLLMSYRNDMTLTENEKKVKGLINEGHADTVETVLNACTTGATETKILTDDEIQQLARNFYDAFEGFWTGTDLDKVKQGLNKLSENTFGDLCAVKEFFEKRYGQGDTFFDWIDSDIDYDDEWVDFVDTFSNLKEKYDNEATAAKAAAAKAEEEAKAAAAKAEEEAKATAEKTSADNTKKTSFLAYLKNNYPDWAVFNNQISIEGDFYKVTQGKEYWNFKFDGTSFKLL